MTPEKDSHFHKYNSSPKIFHSGEFLAIEKAAEKLELDLEIARENLPSSIDPGFEPAYNIVRTLRKELSEINRKSRRQLWKDNPDWVKHWELDKFYPEDTI